MMDSSFWFYTLNIGRSIANIEVSHKNCISFYEDVLVLANSVDPDEIPP